MTVNRRRVAKMLGALVLAGPFSAIAAQSREAQAPKRQPSQSQPAQTGPRYIPSKVGTPGGRVGGGTRGTSGRDIFVLSVLAPDHTGLTIHEQPCLFWFISAQTTLPVEITLIDATAVEPLLQARITGAVEPGVHRVRLTDHGVRLATGIAYQWSVTVVPDADRRAHDILASGMIERVQPERALVSRLERASEAEKVSLYAESGLWYDALETVCDRIDRAPADPTPRSDRAALLMQVGLPEITE